ncbi:MAG: hypothetical protein RIB93_11010 [Coleofasciculus sp. D1-CHI-01]|uniref:hypothetical protein n=1 Tax=Coleofasciculus sp. D1-CHI-01 TaxID=3068482 RepID=UPI0032FF36C2
MHPTNDPSAYSTTHSPCTSVPLDLFKSGQLLAIKPDCRGGLIIQKRFYADFVGSGAAVGSSFDVDCTSVYAIGEVEFYAPATYTERQQAFQKRREYCETLQSIVVRPAPLDRATTILHQLSLWLDAKLISEIPSAWIAELAGVLTKTIMIIRQPRPTNPAERLNIH